MLINSTRSKHDTTRFLQTRVVKF